MKRYSATDELLPPFRRALETLLERLRARNLEPKLHETYRSAERSKTLVASGVSRAAGLSMHCYRIAADVICAQHGWDCEKKGCEFFTRLGYEAKLLGMTWGGDWNGNGVTREQREHDLPHVQGVPIAVQGRVRTRPLVELEELLSEYLRPAGGR